MWIKILGTIISGLVYITYKHVCNNCYLYKRNYYMPRYNLVSNFKDCVNAVFKIFSRQPQAFRVVGLDCEMTSTSVNGGHPVPALLQMANPDGYCAIFQLKVMENAQERIKVPYLTDSPKLFLYKSQSENIIREILEDPTVLKVGVAVMNDADYLAESYGLFCKGCLDIRYLAKKAGIEPRGLDYLAKKVLGKEKIEIYKKLKKPWESKNLNRNLIQYALEDARLGVEIFLKLNQTVIERNYSLFRRLFWDEKTYWKHTMRTWRDCIGKHFVFNQNTEHREKRLSWTNYIQRPSSMFICLSKYAHFYPEGNMLPRSFCYVCGVADLGSIDLKMKAMVPVDYNVEFEDERLYYIHLCKECFEECRSKVDYELRQELTEECGAPCPDYRDHQLVTAQRIAANLLSGVKSSKSDNSEWTRIVEWELLKLLKPTGLFQRHLHISTMEIILAMDCWPKSDHGKFVHDYFCLYGGGLEVLRWRWCKKFWQKMRPQHLPPEWKRFYRSEPDWEWIASE